MSAQMKHVVGRLWWANSTGFTHPGLYVWAWGQNRRIVPWRKAKPA